ncbi:MAG: hypothetical protein Q7K43_05015, partial [Candidatus Woesearchaeota archaeon]|nr:hypothetical protein [Candidatus Woesearchaeota archaeon]
MYTHKTDSYQRLTTALASGIFVLATGLGAIVQADDREDRRNANSSKTYSVTPMPATAPVSDSSSTPSGTPVQPESQLLKLPTLDQLSA